MDKQKKIRLSAFHSWQKVHSRKIFILLIIILIIPNLTTLILAQPRWYTLTSVPKRPAAVVFGAGLLPNGLPTPALEDRVTFAANLYKTGKVQTLLMSGERRSAVYDEPAAMLAYAIQLGIPEEAILLDGEGYRTYNTCWRAKNSYHLQQVILVTTDYHLPRALFLCNALGLDAIGVASGWGSSPRGINYFLGLLREVPATYTAFKEVTLGPD